MIRILTKKKQIKILKQLVANGYIFEQKCDDDIECYDKYIENEYDIAFDIGGMYGLALARGLQLDLRKKVE